MVIGSYGTWKRKGVADFLMALFTTGIQTLYLPGIAALKYAQLYEYMTDFVACFFFIYTHARTQHTHM